MMFSDIQNGHIPCGRNNIFPTLSVWQIQGSFYGQMQITGSFALSRWSESLWEMLHLMMNNVDGEFKILSLDIRYNAYLGAAVGLNMMNFWVHCWWRDFGMHIQYV